MSDSTHLVNSWKYFRMFEELLQLFHIEVTDTDAPGKAETVGIALIRTERASHSLSEAIP